MARRSTTIFPSAKEGGYEIALEAMREAVKRGFRVTTNTTVFDGASSNSVRAFFTQMMDAGVEGMMISPGYSYDKAPDQQHFSGRESNQSMFRRFSPIATRAGNSICRRCSSNSSWASAT